MIYCERCGSKLDLDSLFCTNCGARLNGESKKESIRKFKIEKFTSLINLKKLKIYFLIPIFIILIILTWRYANIIKWVHVPVEGDPYRTFYYERKLFFPQDYIQSSRILINLTDRSNLNEASYILDHNYDCLINRGKITKSTSYFKKYGEGEILHIKDHFGYLGPGIATVTKELCRLGLSNISEQSNRPVSINELDFSLAGLLNCQNRKSFLENKNKLIQYVNPYKKMDDYWIYETTGLAIDNFGNYARLPVKQLWLGVCDRKGALDCGKSSFTALIIDMPINEVKNNLLTHRNLEFDFTSLNRDIESRFTKTAHLIKNPNDANTSLLYCDSGNL